MRILKFCQVLKCANAQRLRELSSKKTIWRGLSTSCYFRYPSKTVDGKEGAGVDAVLKKKYSDTLELPKSAFPMKISNEKRAEYDAALADKLQFDQLYNLQRLWREGQPEFILHDGPPYANGDVHIGHAVNKILKDITNRYKLLRGYKVNYIPGWDCHGLPIELKAMKGDNTSFLKDPLKIREKAREIVDASIKSQRESFRKWGVMAEWDSVYRTIDKPMLQAQLKAFYKLYQKGLVYRDLKPVYWSPSSGSCLAEAELEYNHNHESPSIYLGIDLTESFKSFSEKLNQTTNMPDGPIRALIWTTTPWTLPSNKAIAFNENQEYSVLRYSLRSDDSYLIVATHLVKEMAKAVGKSFTPVFNFPGSQLANFNYRHPWFENEVCPFLHGDHVAGNVGTGLVHTAPAHGQDDFVLGLKHKLESTCYVDDNGNFDSQIPFLKGLPVLSGGNKAVIHKLKEKIIRPDIKTIHSYPYDWRTKKPVIIKASMQWFLDTDKLKAAALDELENVDIYPKNVENVMGPMIERRPFWCISRQRAWGVPIPVLYKKESGEPYIDESVIDEMCKLIETTGGLDFWWTGNVSDIVKDENLASELVKGRDIFDIWLDSGLTWQVLGDKVADVYMEGVDQFQGWFQSSLLTSVGLRGHSPYKSLYVHGFVVDEEGRKMSKSLGNVLDPDAIINGGEKHRAFGTDTLRWWVAAQGSADGCNIEVSNQLLKASEDGVQKLRNVLRFLISYCNEEAITELDVNNISYDELMYTDQYMLKVLMDFQREVTGYYETMNYHRALMKTLHFATTEVSALYLTWVKDRLYCDHRKSESRKSCLFVMNQIYLTLAKVLAPILPFLVEESYSHYRIGNHSIFKSVWFDVLDLKWNNEQIASVFKLVMDIRTSLNHVIGANNPKDIWVEIVCSPDAYKTLEILHPVIDSDIEDKCDSELCDLLQVSGIDLRCAVPSEDKLKPVKFSVEPVGVSHSLAGYSLAICKTSLNQCARCRRYCCVEGNVLCSRCMSVMQRLLRKQSQEESETVIQGNIHSEELKEMASKKT